jgi:hypothetical protein
MPRKIYFKDHLKEIAKASFSDAAQTAENGLRDKGTWMSISPENKLVLNIKENHLQSITRTYSSHPDAFFKRYGLTLEKNNKNYCVTLGSIGMANKTSQKQKRLAALAVINKLRFLTFSDRLKKILTAPIQALKASPTSDHLENLTAPQFAYHQSTTECVIYLLVPDKVSTLKLLVKEGKSGNYLKRLYHYNLETLARKGELVRSILVKEITLNSSNKKIDIKDEIHQWIDSLKSRPELKKRKSGEKAKSEPVKRQKNEIQLTKISDLRNNVPDDDDDDDFRELIDTIDRNNSKIKLSGKMTAESIYLNSTVEPDAHNNFSFPDNHLDPDSDQNRQSTNTSQNISSFWTKYLNSDSQEKDFTSTREQEDDMKWMMGR